jgi:Zn-dependent protease
MLKKWRLGSLAGFPVEISLSFLLLLGAVLLLFGASGGVLGVLLSVLILFGSVLLHELGHALVARRLGVPVSSIELNFFGGAAKMTELPRTANHEVAIAAAGPAVSLVLAGAGFGLGMLLGSELLLTIGVMNAILAGFNLIPALPMDGGRILRALLTRTMDFVRATDLAVGVSRVAAIGFAIAGFLGSFQLLLLAPFLWMLGTQEKRLARHVADRYDYDASGYTQRGWGEPEVMPRGWSGGAAPRGRFVIRERGGRLVVEMV